MTTETKSVDIDGLNCPNCAAKVERAVVALPGVRDADVRFETGTARLEYDPGTVSLARIAYTVENTGCDSSLFTISIDGRHIGVDDRRAAADGGDGSHEGCCDDGEETDDHSNRAPF